MSKIKHPQCYDPLCVEHNPRRSEQAREWDYIDLYDLSLEEAMEQAAKINTAVAAEERRANDSIVENVRLLNRLAEERSKVKAAEKLCELYFNIAEEVIGEIEVRRRRDDALSEDECQ